MKRIISTFERYKYLIVISLCSALIVVLLQTVVNSVFSPGTQDLQNIYLEQASGEIIPNTKSQTTNQLVSTLQAHELSEFQTNGQYEDKLASQVVKRVDVQLERLFVDLDGSTDPQARGNGENVRMTLGSGVDMETSLCTAADQNRQSCTMYLVDKSGHSIPFIVRLLSTNGSSRQSAINVRREDVTESYSSIFSGQPIELNIRAM